MLKEMQEHQFQESTIESSSILYLEQVKLRFSNQPQVYSDFLNIFNAFHSRSIDMKQAILRTCNLFQRHPDLIFGFNIFLSKDYRIGILPNGKAAIWYNFGTTDSPDGTSTFTTNLTIFPSEPSLTNIPTHISRSFQLNPSSHTISSRSSEKSVLDSPNLRPSKLPVSATSVVNSEGNPSENHERKGNENVSLDDVDLETLQIQCKNSDELRCPVCLLSTQDLPDGRYFTAPLCGHIICDKCLDMIEASSRKCPVCKKELRTCQGLYL